MHVQECTDDISTFSGLCTTRILAPVVCLFLTVFYRFLPIFLTFLETSTLNNYHSEDSRQSGSRRIEFSWKSATFLV